MKECTAQPADYNCINCQTSTQKLGKTIPHLLAGSPGKVRQIRTIEMGINPITKTMDYKQPHIKFIKVNLQNSKTATANFMKNIEDKYDILFILSQVKRME